MKKYLIKYCKRIKNEMTINEIKIIFIYCKTKVYSLYSCMEYIETIGL